MKIWFIVVSIVSLLPLVFGFSVAAHVGSHHYFFRVSMVLGVVGLISFVNALMTYDLWKERKAAESDRKTLQEFIWYIASQQVVDNRLKTAAEKYETARQNQIAFFEERQMVFRGKRGKKREESQQAFELEEKVVVSRVDDSKSHFWRLRDIVITANNIFSKHFHFGENAHFILKADFTAITSISRARSRGADAATSPPQALRSRTSRIAKRASTRPTRQVGAFAFFIDTF